MPVQTTGVVMQSSSTRNSLDRESLTVARRMSRWSRVVASICVGIVALAASAASASAQWRVGGFIGGEHESSWDEFLVVGADARGTVGAHSFELNPRASYFIRSRTTRFQLDFNVIKPLSIQGNSKIVPYIGTGVALEKVSYDDDDTGAADQTNVGFNYITGASINTSSRVQPYAQFVYTVLNDSANNAVISFGLHFKLGSSK